MCVELESKRAEEDVAVPMYGRRMSPVRRGVAKRHVPEVNVILAGQTLSTVYCQNDACRTQTGGNFTYYVPLHSTMPANLTTLSLQLSDHSTQSSMVLCSESYQSRCPDITSAKAVQRDNVTWALPVGSYHSSSYVFRVDTRQTSTSQSFCDDASVQVGVDFYEFGFYFERRCVS